jgi:hypothetical protein
METTDPAVGVDAMQDLIDSIDGEPEESTAESSEPEAEEPTAEPEEVVTEEPTEEAEAEEVEFDGKRLAIPKNTPPELVSAVKKMADDLKADYTRKTQEAAEEKRTVAIKAQAVQAQEQLLNANFQRAVALKAAQDKLSQYDKLDWQSIAQQDPAQATQLNLAQQQLSREVQKLYAEWQHGESERARITDAQRRQAIEEGQRELQKHIPKWSPEVQKAIAENTKSYGYTDEELASVTDPRLVRVLHDALQWKKLQAEKPKAMQKVADAPKVLKPSAPQPKKTNQSAIERLKKFGRVEDFASLL